MKLVTYGSWLVCVVIAVALSVRRDRHRWIAGWFVFVPALHLALRHVDGDVARALYLLGPCSVVGLVALVFGRVDVVRTVGCTTLVWIALVVATIGLDDPSPVYAAGSVAVLCAGLLAGLRMRRHDGDITDVCVSLVAAWWGAGDLIAGYIWTDPWTSHLVTQRLAVFVLAVLACMQGGVLWRSFASSSHAR